MCNLKKKKKKKRETMNGSHELEFTSHSFEVGVPAIFTCHVKNE